MSEVTVKNKVVYKDGVEVDRILADGYDFCFRNMANNRVFFDTYQMAVSVAKRVYSVDMPVLVEEWGGGYHVFGKEDFMGDKL